MKKSDIQKKFFPKKCDLEKKNPEKNVGSNYAKVTKKHIMTYWLT